MNTIPAGVGLTLRSFSRGSPTPFNTQQLKKKPTDDREERSHEKIYSDIFGSIFIHFI